MNKGFIKALIGASVLISTASVFAANKVDVSLSSAQVEKNSVTYSIVTVYNDKGEPVTDAKLFIKATPSFMTTTSGFVNCKSAEGIGDRCVKADPSLAGVKAAYVAEVKTKDQEGKVKLDVYLDGNVYSKELQIGAASTEVVKTDEPATAEVASEAVKPETIKAGGHTNGVWYLVLGILAAVSVAYTTRDRKKNA